MRSEIQSDGDPKGALGSLRRAEALLREGRSDEEVERVTGATPSGILFPRAGLASAAARRRPDRSTGRRLRRLF